MTTLQKDTLSARRHRMLLRLAEGCTHAEIAAEENINRVSVTRFARQPATQAYLRSIQEEAAKELCARLPELLRKSLDAVNQALSISYVSSEKLKAASTVLKVAEKLLGVKTEDPPLEASCINDNDTAPSPASEPPPAHLDEYSTAPKTHHEAMTMTMSTASTNYERPNTLRLPADPSILQDYVPVRDIIDVLRDFGAGLPIGFPAQEHAWKCIEELMRFQATRGVWHLADAATTAAKGAQSEQTDEGHQTLFQEREIEIRAAMDAFNVFKRLEDMLFGLDSTSLILRRS